MAAAEGFDKPKLKKIDLGGGVPQALADDPAVAQIPTWGSENVIVFPAGNDKGILRKVSASGGDVVDVTKLDTSIGERYHMWPSFLPDGRHFLYLAWIVGLKGEMTRATLYVGSTNPQEPRTRLMDSVSMAFYAKPGYLIYGTSQNALAARPFDADRLRFTGEAVTLVDTVQLFPTGRLGADASEDGTLIYRSVVANSSAPAPLAWQDRNAKVSNTTCGFTGPKVGWRLSRDGKRVAGYSAAGTTDIWLCDLDSGQPPIRLNNDVFSDREPVWSPDASHVMFQSFRSSGNTESVIYDKASNTATPEQLVLPGEPGVLMAPLDWSRDGKWLIFSKRKGQAQRDLWLLPLDGSRKARPYLENDFDKTQATLSPDTRYLAYASNETGGNYDVLVQTFPDPSNGKVRIAANGCCPRWNDDGTELFYVDMTGRIVSVPVKTTPRFQSGRPVVLDASTSLRDLGRFDGSFSYDVSPDGQRFLLDGQPAAAVTRVSPVTVFLNWPFAVKH